MTINKESINQQVYNLLRDQIIKQELGLGEQINLRKIASDYGISIMPVRDALLRLTNQGLVINKPRVGFFVRTFNVDEVREIMEVRKLYELYCLSEYFEQINPTELQRLLHQHEINEVDSLPRQVFDRLDAGLHDCIIKATANSFLISQYNQLFDIFYLFRYLNLNRYQQAYHEHKKLIKAIIAKQRQLAIDILTEHITGASAVIIENLQKSSAGIVEQGDCF